MPAPQLQMLALDTGKAEYPFQELSYIQQLSVSVSSSARALIPGLPRMSERTPHDLFSLPDNSDACPVFGQGPIHKHRTDSTHECAIQLC